jgi:nucleotide-binding universal stress UspA family protein
MKIVVGVSDLVVADVAESQSAINWAMEFGEPRGAIVELVHVVDTTWGHAPEGYLEEALLAAEEGLRDRANIARERAPGVAIESHVRFGSPVSELVRAAEMADFLVIGAHPEDRYDGASRRTVRLAGLASCSVIVVPSSIIPAGEGVVVGVDGSADSASAVQFAADLADRYGESLTVVLAWGHPESWAMMEPVLVEADPSEEDRLIIAESIAGLATRYPHLVIHTEVSGSRPERALYAAGIDARMLVVGSRGRHGLARAMLGSVSEELVSELPCAIAVVRPKAT